MPIGAQQSWMNFAPDSPSYYGAQGIGIPQFMRDRFGGSTPNGQYTGAQSYAPGGMSQDQGGQPGQPGQPGATGSDNIKPQWFRDYENRQTQLQFLDQPRYSTAQAPATQNPAAPDAAPTTAPNMAAQSPAMAPPSDTVPAPPAPQPMPAQPQGIGVPSPDAISAAPAAPAAPTTAPVPSQSASPAQAPAANPYAGLGTAVSNSWYHDTNPAGGNYGGDYNGQPIYWHFGNQTADDQFKNQYQDLTKQGSPQPITPTTSPPVQSLTPTPVENPNPNASPAPVVNNNLPEALGGSSSSEDWVNHNADYAARSMSGFGDNIPEALGGTMKMARGGAVRGYAHGGEVDMDGHMGLVHAARQLSSYGQGPDTSLAHISPDESAMLDYLQGGRNINPHTGLAQYSIFGDILKAVARVAATTIGFTLGGPLGAAAGSAAATKLTGGSWKDALISGGLSGVTAGIGNYMQGAPILQSGNAAVTSAAFEPGLTAGAGLRETLKNAVQYAGTTPGLVSAAINTVPALGQMPKSSGPPPGWQAPGTPINTGYDPKNLPSWYAPNAGKKAATAGHEAVADDEPGIDPNDPEYLSQKSLQFAGVPGMAAGGQVGLGAPPAALLDAANWGYVNAEHGGAIHGPGGPRDDLINARLSDGEHVIDAQTIGDAGALVGKPGDNDAGQEVVEKIKHTIRRAAGRKNPKSPTSPMKAA